jgi:pimeloyl-ACP methyl ester carboxylesterase
MGCCDLLCSWDPAAVVPAVGWVLSPGERPAAEGESVMSSEEPTVVLVHGAFADASSWAAVVEGLRARGFAVRAVANELRGGAADGERLAAQIAGLGGPMVLVGHSYGGVVITEAAARSANVIGLVYIAAFALDEGEAIMELLSRFPANGLSAALVAEQVPGRSGDETQLTLAPEKYREVFAADVSVGRTEVLALSQRPILASAFEEKAGPAAWKNVPSWYLVAAVDEAIQPQAQRAMAERAGSTVVEVEASHSVAVWQPAAIVDLIGDAVAASMKEKRA